LRRRRAAASTCQKATVSDQVQALENALGVRLLNRTTRRVGLTEIGRSYYGRCVQILHDLEEADETAGAQQATPRSQLRVHCQQGIVQFVAPVVVDFLTRYPEASVDLRHGNTMIDIIEEGFDLAISPFPSPDATLVRRRLTTFRLVLSAAPAYLERHPAPQSPADLAHHNCLRSPYAPGFAEGWHFLDPSGNPVVARVSGNLITSSPDTMRAAAVAGIGLVLTAPYIVAGLLASGALVPLLLPSYRTQEFEINAFYPHRRHLSAKVRAFIDMLITWFVEQSTGSDQAEAKVCSGHRPV